MAIGYRLSAIFTSGFLVEQHEQLDRQIATLVENRADPIDVENLAKTIGTQVDQRVSALMDRGDTKPVDIEALTKSVSEQIDRRMGELVNRSPWVDERLSGVA